MKEWSAKLLLKYHQYDVNAAFYTLLLVILTHTCFPSPPLTPTLFSRVIKRCAHHAWLQSTCPWFLMACGTLRACGRRAMFSVPPSAHPPATRSATFSHRTPMARRPLFPVFLSTLASWALTHREFSLLFAGCSWNKSGRRRPHQRLAEQNTRGGQNARRKTCGRLQVLTVTTTSRVLFARSGHQWTFLL